MCTKQTHPIYSVGSYQDEAEIQYDRLSIPIKKVKRCQLPTSLQCVCCHEIPAAKAFHLKFKVRLSWSTAVLEFFAVEFNCVGNHFLEEFLSEIS